MTSPGLAVMLLGTKAWLPLPTVTFMIVGVELDVLDVLDCAKADLRMVARRKIWGDIMPALVSLLERG